MFSTFHLATLLQLTFTAFAAGYLTCALLHSFGFRGGRWPWQ